MPINTVYPLDLSGAAIDNRIVGEAKHIAVDPDRVFIPTGGPFYTKSLRVKRNGVLLSPFTDYKCLELNVDGTLASGKEVCNVILISAAGTDFTIDYQVIGGEYSDLSNELASLIANTPLNQLGVLEWGGIVNKPLKYPPSIHYHFPFEWRGYTGVLAQLEAMRQAIISSDSSSLSTIFTFIQENIQYITSEYLSANALIYIDHNPTPSGNVLLKGNGTQASPLGLDLNELFQEFDLRYLRNVMNPVSRVGIVGTTTLPIVADTGFAIRITDTLPVNIAGIQGSIAPQVLSLPNSSYSNVTDPSNKTIFVYIVLELGQPRLHFSATALADTVSVVYIGKIVTDSVGVIQTDLRPVSRIDSYRPSATPQGSSFSVSSGTADMFQRLNWDADIPGNDSGPPDPEPDPEPALHIKFTTSTQSSDAQIQEPYVTPLTVIDNFVNFSFNTRKVNLRNNSPFILQFNGLPDGILEVIDSSGPNWREFKSVNWVNLSSEDTLTYSVRTRIKPTAIITEPITFTLNITNAGVTSNTVTLTINPPAVVLKFTENQQNANSPIESSDIPSLSSVDPDAPFWMNVRLFNLPDNVPMPINFTGLPSGLLQYKLNGGTDQWAELLGLNWSAGVKPVGVTAYTYSLQLRVNPTTPSVGATIHAQAAVNGAMSNSAELTVETGERYLTSEWYNAPIVGGGTIDARPKLEERIGNDPFYLGITYRGMPVGATAQIEFYGDTTVGSHYQRWNDSVWVDVGEGETFTIPTTHTVLSMQQYYTLNVQFRLKPGSDTGLLVLIDCTTTMAQASDTTGLLKVKSQA